MRVVRDRRSSLRVLIPGEVFVYTDRANLEAHCVDLGLGGMLVHSVWPTHTKRLVTLEAFIATERLRLDAELVRQREVADGHELAFRFVDLVPGSVQQLASIIQRRLAESSQSDYAQAFEAGALAAPPPGGSPAPVSGETSISPTPVISGLTEAIDVRPPWQHTVVATPEPPAIERTIRVDSARAYFEQAEEDEVTGVFRRITDPVGAGFTERQDREGRPLPPERTVIASALPEPKEPEPEPGPAGPLRVPEPGRPEPVEPTVTPILAAYQDGRAPSDGPPTVSLTSEAPVSPPTAKVVVPPRPPTLLRGGVPETSRRAAPVEDEAPLRPSQRALRDAMALLRRRQADEGAPRRRPRVIVSVPHRTYRARSMPWSR